MSRDRRFSLHDAKHDANSIEHAFDECYRQTLNAVYSYALSLMHSPDQAKDAIHDVYTAVWERWPPWRAGDSPRAYLFRAVRNRILSIRRHETVVQRLATSPAADAEVPGMGSPTSSPEFQAITHDTRRILRAAIQDLPERQRSALLLWWDQDLSLKEIAEVLEISPPAAHKLLAKAQAKILEVAKILK